MVTGVSKQGAAREHAGQSGRGNGGCSVQAARESQDGRMARAMHAAGTMSAQAVSARMLAAMYGLHVSASMQGRLRTDGERRAPQVLARAPSRCMRRQRRLRLLRGWCLFARGHRRCLANGGPAVSRIRASRRALRRACALLVGRGDAAVVARREARAQVVRKLAARAVCACARLRPHSADHALLGLFALACLPRGRRWRCRDEDLGSRRRREAAEAHEHSKLLLPARQPARRRRWPHSRQSAFPGTRGRRRQVLRRQQRPPMGTVATRQVHRHHGPARVHPSHLARESAKAACPERDGLDRLFSPRACAGLRSISSVSSLSPCFLAISSQMYVRKRSLLRRVTLDDRPAAPETHLCLGR
jgi:hypothetical protein